MATDDSFSKHNQNTRAGRSPTFQDPGTPLFGHAGTRGFASPIEQLLSFKMSPFIWTRTRESHVDSRVPGYPIPALQNTPNKPRVCDSVPQCTTLGSQGTWQCTLVLTTLGTPGTSLFGLYLHPFWHEMSDNTPNYGRAIIKSSFCKAVNSLCEIIITDIDTIVK